MDRQMDRWTDGHSPDKIGQKRFKTLVSSIMSEPAWVPSYCQASHKTFDH